MRKKKLAVSVFALLLILGTIGLVIRQFRIGNRLMQADYARIIDRHDIVDSSRNAFEALSDAELRAENYLRTGDAGYLKAYKEDVQTWEDESGTLTGIVGRDKARQAAAEFAQDGKKTIEQLDASVSLFARGERHAALDTIQTGSSIVGLGSAHKHLLEIIRIEEVGAGGSTPLLSEGLASSRRLAEYAGALFCLALCLAGLNIVADRSRPL